MFKTSSQTRTSPTHPAAKPDQSILTAAKGGGITFTSSLFAYAVRFVAGIVVTRLLGSEKFGLYSLAQTASGIAAGLALLGLSSALVRYVSFFGSRRDEEGVWETLQIGIGLPAVVSVFFGIGLYTGASWIANRVFHEPKLIYMLRLASLGVPFLTLSQVFAAATRGFKKMRYTAIAQNIVQPLIKLVLVVALALTGLTAVKTLAAQILAVVVGSMMRSMVSWDASKK